MKAQEIRLNERGASPAGTLFRCLYVLFPSLDGLRWKGQTFPDLHSLMERAEREPDSFTELSQMLQEGCFSFLFRMGAKKGNAAAQFALMEAWEREESGKGAYRALRRPTRNAAFL